jgi:hypothetical protein
MRRVILTVVSICIAVLVVGCASAACAQAPQVLGPDTSVGAALRSLASRAGVVFVGRVTAVVPRGGVVEVSFAVEQPVLGAVGATYSMREWAGLWAAWQPRYRVGQRAMFFLHAPGAAGLSSPVDGMEGMVPVLATGDGAPELDVRWLAARVLRASGAPIADAENGAVALSEARSVVAAWRTSQAEPKQLPLPVEMRPVAVTVTQGMVHEAP